MNTEDIAVNSKPIHLHLLLQMNECIKLHSNHQYHHMAESVDKAAITAHVAFC